MPKESPPNESPPNESPSLLSNGHYQELIAFRVVEKMRIETREQRRWKITTSIMAIAALVTLGLNIWNIRGFETRADVLDPIIRTFQQLAEPKLEPESTGGAPAPGDQLDAGLEPDHGEISLQAGFLPDPDQLRLSGGGDINALNLNQPDCVGYVEQAPDVRLEWQEQTEELRIYFEAEDRSADTTLLVRSSQDDGAEKWFCNDDSSPSSFNPMVILKNPPEGQYQIWVGSYQPERSISGILSITELELMPATLLDTFLDAP